jgi:hypothetical protein
VQHIRIKKPLYFAGFFCFLRLFAAFILILVPDSPILLICLLILSLKKAPLFCLHLYAIFYKVNDHPVQLHGLRGTLPKPNQLLIHAKKRTPGFYSAPGEPAQ